MATQTTVTVTDDLDGTANATEVTFSLNGESWTIDLSAKNRAALEKALKPYIAKATNQGRRRPAASVRKTARRGPARWCGAGGGAAAAVVAWGARGGRGAVAARGALPCWRARYRSGWYF